MNESIDNIIAAANRGYYQKAKTRKRREKIINKIDAALIVADGQLAMMQEVD